MATSGATNGISDTSSGYEKIFQEMRLSGKVIATPAPFLFAKSGHVECD